MKSTLVIESRTRSQLETLMRVAHEMGMKVSLLHDAFRPFSAKEEDRLWMGLTENSLADEWGDPANDHWDEFFRTAPKI